MTMPALARVTAANNISRTPAGLITGCLCRLIGYLRVMNEHPPLKRVSTNSKA